MLLNLAETSGVVWLSEGLPSVPRAIEVDTATKLKTDFRTCYLLRCDMVETEDVPLN